MRLRVLAVGGAVVAAFMVVFSLVNLPQSGYPLMTGYPVIDVRVPAGYCRDEGIVSSSFAGAAMRQASWAFGWPMSFLFLPFARRTPGPATFFFQAEDGIRGGTVTGVQTCALPI